MMKFSVRLFWLLMFCPLIGQAQVLRWARYPDVPPFYWQGDIGADTLEIDHAVVVVGSLPVGSYVVWDANQNILATFDYNDGNVTVTNAPEQLTATSGFPWIGIPKGVQNHPELYTWGGNAFYAVTVDGSHGFSPAHYVRTVTYYVSASPPPPSPQGQPGRTKLKDIMEGGDELNLESQADGDTGDDGNKGGGGGGPCPSQQPGMLRYSAHALLASLCMADRPLSYQPAFGPAIDLRISYDFADVQPVAPVSAAANGFSNLGPQWTCSWFSYVTDDPNDSSTAAIYARGGGTESYSQFDPTSQSYARDPQSHCLLVRLTGNSYEKQFPSGVRYRFEQSDGSDSYPRHIFLTKVFDPQGNEADVQYDAFNRLMSVTDATGKVTQFSYDSPISYYLITKVTDPYGRFCQIQYYPDGRLQSITDAIGLTSTVAYEAGDNFINSLTTPYTLTTPIGAATFSHGADATGCWVQMTDALGSAERVEYRDYAPGIADTESNAPAGFDNSALNVRNTFYWDKKAQMVAAGDYTQAHVIHWLQTADGTATSGVPDSEKSALESRIWYTYDGQSAANVEGTNDQPNKVARVLDDGSTQLIQISYNMLGNVVQRVDPVGRSTTYVYFDNQMDLQEVHQTSNGINDLLASFGNYVGRLPQTLTDASGNVTNMTYTAQGQPQTVTNPKGEIAHYDYVTTPTQNGYGHIQKVTRAFGTSLAAAHNFTYDSADRLWTATDEDNYTLTFAYDAIGGDPLKSLDRVTTITHPDGTYEENDYNMLDVSDRYDRLRQKAHMDYDALQRVSAITDANNHKTQYGWCACGALDTITDANGYVTHWIRDVQNRPIYKSWGGDQYLVYRYTYEDSTSRLQEVDDGNGATTNYTYYADDHVSTISMQPFTGSAAPPLSYSYSYDQNYDRLSGFSDVNGQTTYSYNPITNPPSGLGAGQLSSIIGPSGNQANGYTLAYQYDQLGRVLDRSVDGPNNDESVEYNALGMIYSDTNALGNFGTSYVGGNTNRVDYVTYPNGQQVKFGYDTDASHDRTLLEIKNLDPLGGILSKFNYTHAATGRIDSWTQSNSALTAPRTYSLNYDAADQLNWAQLDDPNAGSHLYAYAYDLVGNRLTEQTDNQVLTTTNYGYLTQTAGGLMYFQGTLDQNATVTIGSNPASVTLNPAGGPAQPFQFSGWAQVAVGVNNVPITATEADVTPGLAPHVTSRYIQLTVNDPGMQRTGFDSMGNSQGDFRSSFVWDDANRLFRINNSAGTTELTYDALGRRVKMVLSQGGTALSERHYIWDGMSIVEERDGNNQVTNATSAMVSSV